MKYQRVLIKLSGEALAADSGKLYDGAFMDELADVISQCASEGVQLGVLVGAGNIWRGRQGTDMDRVNADLMGMLATTINAIALKDVFERHSIPCKVVTATPMEPFGEYFSTDRVLDDVASGTVVIFAGGSGHPFFSTDTAASLRAAQMQADAILMAKNIDGIYDRDPNGPQGHLAKKYSTISCSDIIAGKLHAIDLTSATLNMETGVSAVAFALDPPANILRVIHGEEIGTTIIPD